MEKNNTIKWIVALCITATLAIVGWTVTAGLAARTNILVDMQETTAALQENTMSNNVRLSVLENKYDTIQAALSEIKVLLQKHMEK